MRRRIFKLGATALAMSMAVYVVARFLPGGWLGFPTYASVETICPGDVNHDDQRDIRDVVAIQAHILGKKPLTGELLTVADVNQDSKVDVLDIARLIQHITRRKLLVDCKGTLKVSPASLDFGGVALATSKDLTVNVQNGGNAKLTITAITSTNAQFAAVSPMTPFEVAPGAERAVTVRFSPTSVASHSGTLTVSGSSSGSAMSAEVTLAGTGLTAANPSPTLTKITPGSVTAGSGALTLTLEGTNFVSQSQILWDGSPRPTTFVSATQLRASIGAGDVATDDIVLVRVMNPAPGGGLSAVQYFTVNPVPTSSSTKPYLRGLAPTKGPAGTLVTILGSGFSTAQANNVVRFYRKGSTKTAAVQSATEGTLVCQVPSGLEQGSWAVSVTAAGQESRTAGFEVTSSAPYLTVFPSMAFLLMPPGSGKELLIIGGGTPPYKLKPLKAEHQALAKAEIKGSVIEVTGLSTGPYYAADVTIEIQDSAATPATVSATVRVQTPQFDPSFDVSFPSLLAGSSPSFALKLSDTYGHMRLAKVRFKFQNATIDCSGLTPPVQVAYGDVDGGSDFTMLTVSAVDSPSRANFTVTRLVEEAPVQTATGTLEPTAITNVMDPSPREEGIVFGGTDVWTRFDAGLIRLPSSPGASFTVSAIMTSVTTCAGKTIPLTKVLTKSFTTVAPAPGSPTITALLGDQGAIGDVAWIEGSGLGPTTAGNEVTFAAADGTRLKAEVKSVNGNRLSFVVPYGAVTGPVRLDVNGKTSNDYEFSVRFHPEVFISFPTFASGAAAAPHIVMEQEWGELRIGGIRITSDRGTFTAATLTKDQPAGTIHEYDGSYASSYPLYYRGQEPDGAKRHIFDFSSGYGKIYASTNASGQGVTLELTRTGGFDVAGSQVVLAFEKGIIVAPSAKGVSVAFEVSVDSVKWSFGPDLMNVRFRYSRITE